MIRPDPNTDRCARCRVVFHCGANDLAPCPCTTVKLDGPMLVGLRERFDTCLCLSCLRALALADRPTDPGDLP
jgi:hypothetical protein